MSLRDISTRLVYLCLVFTSFMVVREKILWCHFLTRGSQNCNYSKCENCEYKNITTFLFLFLLYLKLGLYQCCLQSWYLYLKTFFSVLLFYSFLLPFLLLRSTFYHFNFFFLTYRVHLNWSYCYLFITALCPSFRCLRILV